MLDDDLPAQVEAILLEAGVPADALTLEVTESAIMVDPTKAQHVLKGLKAVGVMLSIDDFGTGYSSLAYLKHLPVDEVKIDQSFIRGWADGDDPNRNRLHSTLGSASSGSQTRVRLR